MHRAPSTALVLVLLAALATLAPCAEAQSGAVVAVFADIWSLDPQSPEIGLVRAGPFDPVSAADIFIGAFPPPPLFPCVCEARALGIFAPNALDDVDGLSLPNSPCVPFPPPPANDLRIEFSIDRASVGVDPVIVAETAAGADGAAADIFSYVKNAGAPAQIVLFQNNAPPRPNSFFLTPRGPGVVESNVDAWYSQGGFQVGTLAPLPPLLPAPNVYHLTLGPGTAAALGLDPATIYTPDGLGALIPAAGAAIAGLLPGDDVDALSVGPGVVYFSLAPGSPSLAANGWSAADILKWTPAGGIVLWAPAAALGLAFGDNLDALYVWDPGTGDLVDDCVSNVGGPASQNVVTSAYFDVETTREVMLWVKDLSLVSNSSTSVQIWVTTEGGYASKVNDPSGWVLLDTAVVGSFSIQPEGWPTPLPPVHQGLQLACGEVRGFFVTATSTGAPALGTNPTSSGADPLASSSEILVKGGVTTSSATPGSGTLGGNGAPAFQLCYANLGPGGTPSPFTGGQAPQPGFATLDVGCGLNASGLGVSSGQPGPYETVYSVSTGGFLGFSFTGTPFFPIILLEGPMNPGVGVFPGIGQLDIGVPGSPLPQGINVLADGNDPTSPLNLFFVNDAAGRFEFGYGGVSTSIIGAEFTFQAAVFNPGPTTVSLSNACRLVIAP